MTKEVSKEFAGPHVAIGGGSSSIGGEDFIGGEGRRRIRELV